MRSENIRIANTTDPITLLPISSYYKHVNNCICINEQNIAKEIVTDMNWFWRLIYLPFEIYYKSIFSRHKCDEYINRLLILGEWKI
jgi:hypothetical protein